MEAVKQLKSAFRFDKLILKKKKVNKGGNQLAVLLRISCYLWLWTANDI